MSLRAIDRHVKYRAVVRHDSWTFIPSSAEMRVPLLSVSITQVTFSPSRRTQEGSKDNAALRLDSSLETPTVNSPRCLFRQCLQQPSCMNALTAISLEV
jgi:hypothetical protein